MNYSSVSDGKTIIIYSLQIINTNLWYYHSGSFWKQRKPP